MSLVRLRNIHDEKTYVLKHDEHGDTVLPPGEERIVDLEVALVNFGNPGAKNLSPANRIRDGAIKDLHTLWGFYDGLHSDDAWDGIGWAKLEAKEAGPFKPQIEVYDLDGNRMWMIHDDPAGIHGSQDVDDRIVDVTSGRAIEAELAAVQAQVRYLSDMLAAQSAAQQGSAPSDDPSSTESKMAAAIADDGTQAERNAARFDIPKAAPDATVGRDKPRTTRSGSRVTVG